MPAPKREHLITIEELLSRITAHNGTVAQRGRSLTPQDVTTTLDLLQQALYYVMHHEYQLAHHTHLINGSSSATDRPTSTQP